VRPALAALRDYERQAKAGIDPTFDPIALNIKGAAFWERAGEVEAAARPGR
jgi:AGCS family alanine or glycine:cation symporter